MFNTEIFILVPTASRFNFAKNRTLAIIGFVKEWELAQKFIRVKFSIYHNAADQIFELIHPFILLMR